MGQQHPSNLKSSINNEVQTFEYPPTALKTFALHFRSSKIEKTGNCEFTLNKGKQNEYVIMTNKEITNLAIYKGYVEITAAKKKVFAGMVNELKREGFGIEYDDSEKVFYRGEFSNDRYDGWGQTVKYQGEFKCGKKEGWGKWNDADSKTFYEGFFKEDKISGFGYLNLQLDEISKFVNEDHLIELTEKVEKRYAGEWSEGRMNGNGKLQTLHEVYKGRFSEGVYNGQGVLKKECKVFEGKFYNGQLV